MDSKIKIKKRIKNDQSISKILEKSAKIQWL